MKKILLLIVFMTTTPVPAQTYQAGDHELALMPTAYQMQKGQSYFTDYELLFLNYTYAPANRLHVSIFSFFPINKEFTKSLSLGVKYQILNIRNIKTSLNASYAPKTRLSTVGFVSSFGKPSSGFHLGLNLINSQHDEHEKSYKSWLYMAGYRVDTGKRTSLLIECINIDSPDTNTDSSGFVSLGIRFRGKDVTWDLAGFRPFEDAGDLLFFPLLKATFLIN